MSFKNLKISPTYTSDDTLNNPARDFYNPVLAEAKTYKRIAGYFSSSSFAFIGKGLKSFIFNGGHMQFIFNVQLSEEDYENILLGFDFPERIIESKFLEDFSKFEDECIYNHAKVLGWLIARKRLEIKIGYISDGLSSGSDEAEDTIPNSPRVPILHQKLGIIEDSDGNTIAFNGSNNESANGWMYNNEYLTTFCSWKRGHSDFIENISDNFETLWNDQGNRTRVISFPEAVEQQLIRIAPKDEMELTEILHRITKDQESSADSNIPADPESVAEEQWSAAVAYSVNSPEAPQYAEPQYTPASSKVKLRDYQKLAVDAWFENDCRGMFEMATGTGKTITAISAYNRVLEIEKNLVLLVVCPYSHLPPQWEKAMRNMGIEVTDFLRADSTVTNWSDKIYQAVYRMHNSRTMRRIVVIFATNDTASSKKFRELFEKIQNSAAKAVWMIISDEVHSIGSPVYRNALFDEYKYRLGLSATPKRYFDEEGTKNLFDYFGEPVFEFGLREAIDTINPDTGKTYLVPYDYHVRFTNLTKEEGEKYIDYTRKIIGLKSNIEIEGWTREKEEQLEKWYNSRARILKNAINKIPVFDEVIQELLKKKALSHLLVYCSESDPQQIETVAKHLDLLSKKEKQLIKRKNYTQDKSAKVSKATGKSERDQILVDFDNGNFDVLLAIKCLDEGVDVPSTKTAILLCSSGNSKEYIQRRGRILRPYSGKDKAVLYDIAVLPPSGEGTELAGALAEIIQKERKRMEEFAKDSLNNPDIETLINDYLKKKK